MTKAASRATVAVMIVSSNRFTGMKPKHDIILMLPDLSQPSPQHLGTAHQPKSGRMQRYVVPTMTMIGTTYRCTQKPLCWSFVQRIMMSGISTRRRASQLFLRQKSIGDLNYKCRLPVPFVSAAYRWSPLQ